MPVTMELLRGRCCRFDHYGDSLVFGDSVAVMCASPNNGIQFLSLREDKGCVPGVFYIDCPGCRLNPGESSGLRIRSDGSRVDLRDVVVAR